MFDSHAHVAFDQFRQDRYAVIERAHESGVAGWLEVGTDLKQSKRAIRLAEQHEGVWATVGVHPNDVGTLTERDWANLEKLCKHPKVKAIGEVGLDYYRGGTPEVQLPVLDRFIGLAQINHLPIVLHMRSSREHDAHDDALELLHSYQSDERPVGVMHSYSGTREQGWAYVALGMLLGISGVVTFKNAGKIVDIVREIPIEHLLIETDCPFLAPEPNRGKRNEPSYVAFVAQKIAELKGMSEQEVRFATEQNARNLFHL